MTNFTLPEVSAPPKSDIRLPFGGELHTSDKLVFSFACFDRSNKLFNLGGTDKESCMIEANWFVDFLDCLKNVSVKKINDLKGSVYDLHPVDWKHTNTKRPENTEQCEFWQFRINKSKGRIIGILLRGVFYIVWLDPHHNLTNSEGYGTATYYPPAKSVYEKLVEELETCKSEKQKLQLDLTAAEQLLDEQKNKT